MTTFSLDRFIADCRLALSRDPNSVQDVVARAVSDPGAILRELGEPGHAGIRELHRDDSLTILNLVWPPQMTIMPHDHRMWGVIGVYGGREDNIFWRRVPESHGRELETGRCQSPMCGGCRISWPRCHTFGNQPDFSPHGCDPRLRRRPRCCRAQRMGSRGTDRAAVRPR
jgi:predicted metal-dependent enzyme (double-stranded beta helix superfamily)